MPKPCSLLVLFLFTFDSVLSTSFLKCMLSNAVIFVSSNWCSYVVSVSWDGKNLCKKFSFLKVGCCSIVLESQITGIFDVWSGFWTTFCLWKMPGCKNWGFVFQPTTLQMFFDFFSNKCHFLLVVRKVKLRAVYFPQFCVTSLKKVENLVSKPGGQRLGLFSFSGIKSSNAPKIQSCQWFTTISTIL